MESKHKACTYHTCDFHAAESISGYSASLRAILSLKAKDPAQELRLAMSLALTTRHQLTFGSMSMVVPMNLVETYDGQVFFKLTATHQSTIKLIANDKDVPKNSSIAHSPGLQELKNARNLASGIIQAPSAMQAALSGSAEPKRRTSKLKHRRLVQTPTVLVQISGFDSVELRRAVSLDESILIPMDATHIDTVFKIILAKGLNLSPTRPYRKTGAYSKKDKDDDDEEEDEKQDEAEEQVAEACDEDLAVAEAVGKE